MRKIVFNIFITTLLLICSMLFVSCEAITAQNITNTGSVPVMNGNPGRNGGLSMNGSPRGNGNFAPGRMNADVIGKVISVDGNSIKIELMERSQSNRSSNFNDGNQNAQGNQSNSNRNNQSQRGFPGSTSEMKPTGTYKTLTVGDDVNISQLGMVPQNRNENSKSAVKISDFKEGQIIMIWYKENTETVERISVVQS